MQDRRGFSVLELLTVIALIAVLAAMLFPVLATAREKARATTCTSNLRQIGAAMALYAQDYDDLYPYAANPIDKSMGTGGDPVELASMPLLHHTLRPYLNSSNVWHCPSDTGLNRDGNPSAFEELGTSYRWRTALALKYKLFATGGYRDNQEVGPAEIAVLNELTGKWHGGSDPVDWVFNALMGDGHVTRQNFRQYVNSLMVSLE